MTFPSFPTVSGVSLRADVEIGLGTFPIARERGKKKREREKKNNGLLSSNHHRLASIKIALSCVIGIFMDANEVCGDFPPTLPTHAITRPTFYLVRLEVMCFDNVL